MIKILLISFFFTISSFSQCTIKNKYDKFLKTTTYYDSIGLNGGFTNISVTFKKIIFENSDTV